MWSDLLYFLKGAGVVIGVVFICMIPFFFYLYWLNTKQTRYFKALGKDLGLKYTSMGNKIKRDFPELNGTIKGVQCFVGARRTKGRYGFSAETRNHYPIILLEVALPLEIEKLKFIVSGKEIKHEAYPPLKLQASVLTSLQKHAAQYGDFIIQMSRKGVLQIILLSELSNEKQYKKVKSLVPLIIDLAGSLNFV